MVCAGGDETYGRFVDRPYAAILEERLDRRCLNLGSLFCGVDALCKDRGLFDLLNGSELCILQVPDILGQSNHFYRVHPRRNDRVLAPTENLIGLYPEVDFTDIHFVHHLMVRLQECRDARFEVVVEELQQNWIRQVSGLLGAIEPPTILLRLNVLRQVEAECQGERGDFAVTDHMLEAIRPLASNCVDVPVHVSGQSDELEDMLFGTLQQPMAEHMIGPAAHRSVAQALIGPVRNLN